MIRQHDCSAVTGPVALGIAARAASLALVVVLLVSVRSTHAAESPTDGRLGGTYASFVERFGEPTAEMDQSGVFFTYPDAEYLAIQLYTVASYQLDDPVLFLTVAADRDESLPATERDPGDWSIAEAIAIATDVAPADATFGQPDDSVRGSLSTMCESKTLRQAFGDSGGDLCRATYQLSSDDTVSFVTLSLTSGEEPRPENTVPGPGECAGVVEWANGSAERLDSAQSLLDSLATLSDDPTVAVPDLRDLAGQLEALAEEQRSADAPREIATANYYIIGALTDFAGAIELAADGLEQGDQATVDEAIDDLDAADERAARASEEIGAAVIACDLTTGTPESR